MIASAPIRPREHTSLSEAEYDLFKAIAEALQPFGWEVQHGIDLIFCVDQKHGYKIELFWSCQDWLTLREGFDVETYGHPHVVSFKRLDTLSVEHGYVYGLADMPQIGLRLKG